VSEPLHILIVEDDAVDRKMVKRQLSETSLDLVIEEAASAEESLVRLQHGRIDCVLLDNRLPEMSGLDFLGQLRSQRGHDGLAIVMLTGSGNERLVVQAMRLGVQDYLVKGDFTAEDLEQAVRHAIALAGDAKAQAEKSVELEQLALTDPLTGLGNRNLFNMRLDHALSRARRQSDQVALLYMDLDGFKGVNDTFGHAAGDALLCEVARRLKSIARDADTLVRLGGDEFAVIMETGVSREGARKLAARIKACLFEPFWLARMQAHVGVSIGIAQFPEDADDIDSLFHAADTAMYESKFGKRLPTSVSAQGKGR